MAWRVRASTRIDTARALAATNAVTQFCAGQLPRRAAAAGRQRPRRAAAAGGQRPRRAAARPAGQL